MDTTLKSVSSYQQDQEVLDSRGITMTVEEVAGLSTSRYAERVQALRLTDDDCAFLKGLRRRIKNRLASQNSRRRSVENLRRLTRELRVVRACKGDAVTERHALLEQRRSMLERCRRLREHVELILKERSDPSRIPNLDTIIPKTNKKQKTTEKDESPKKLEIKNETTINNEIIEYKIDKLVENSVNFMYKNENNELKKECVVDNLNSNMDEPNMEVQQNETSELTRKVAAKTIFFDEILNDRIKFESEIKTSKSEYQHIQSYPELTKRIAAKTVLLNGFNTKNNETSLDFERNETQVSSFRCSELAAEFQNSELTNKITAKTVLINGYNTKHTQNHNILDFKPKNETILNFEMKNETKLDFVMNNETHYHTSDVTKKVIAKTVFLNGDVHIQGDEQEVNGVLNLSVKNGRRHHGRKQSAPRKIAYAFCENEDAALDLQVKD